MLTSRCHAIYLSIESQRIGFSSFGICISSNLIARVVYSFVVASVTIASVVLQNRDSWFDDGRFQVSAIGR